jgi:hypothetical protein
VAVAVLILAMCKRGRDETQHRNAGNDRQNRAG